MPKTLTDAEVFALFASRFATSSEAADLLGIAPGAVRRMAGLKHKRLDAQRVGGTLVIARAEIERYRAGKSPRGRKGSRTGK